MGWLDPGNWLQNTVSGVGNALNGGVSPGDVLGGLGSFLFGGGGGGGAPTGNPGSSGMTQADLNFQGPGGGNGAADQYSVPSQWPFAVSGQGPLRPGEYWNGSADPTTGGNTPSPYGQVDNNILQQLIQALAGQAPHAPNMSTIDQPYQQATDAANTNAANQGKSIDAATQQAKDSLAQLMQQANGQTAQDRSQMVADQGGQMGALQAAMAPYAGATGAQGGAVGARLAAQQAQLGQMQAAQASQQSAANSARNAYTDSSMNGTVLQGQNAHNMLSQNLAGLLDKIGVGKTQAEANANNSFNSATSRYQTQLAQLMQKANTFSSGQQQTGSQMFQNDLYNLGTSGDPNASQTASAVSSILFGGPKSDGSLTPPARDMQDALARLGAAQQSAPNAVDWGNVRQLVQEKYDTSKHMPKDIMSRLATFLGA